MHYPTYITCVTLRSEVHGNLIYLYTINLTARLQWSQFFPDETTNSKFELNFKYSFKIAYFNDLLRFQN